MDTDPALTPKARFILLALYALVTFLSFPHPIAGRVLDLGLILAWLGPGLLILGLAGLAPLQAGRHAFLAGLAAASAVLHWIYIVTVSYGHAPVLVGMLAPVLLGSYLAMFTAAFATIWGWLRERNLASPFAAALLWTALEHGRSFILSGYPWASLGYAQHHNAALLGLASLAGVYGLSFTTVLAGAGLADWVGSLRARKPVRLGAWTALALVVVLHPIGLALRPESVPPHTRKLRIAALQGNIDQAVKWSPAWAAQTISIYEALSREAVAQGAQVVVWPETAVPGAIEADSELRKRLSALAVETGASYVVGGVGLEFDPRSDLPRYYDSAFNLDSEGSWGWRYDKSHLVPFGEYLPLRRLWGPWIEAVATGIAAQDVSAGSGPQGLALSLPESTAGAVMVGVPICYELLFPDLVRRFVGEGKAEVLLAITNDAWYGRTGAPYQFLAMTALRSAETGVWTVRAANTGVSAIIDSRGLVRERTDIFERGFVIADVPLRSHSTLAGRAGKDGSTFYVRHGDVFAWSCWIGVAGLLACAEMRRRRGSQP